MNRRTRMQAVAVAFAVTGGLTAAVAPAQATTPSPVSVGFSCTENLLGALPIPLGTLNLPVDLSVLDNLTVPVGTTIAPVTGTLGLAPVLAAVGKSLTDALNVTSSLVAQVGSSQVPLVLNTLGGALQVPSLPLPALPGNLPVSLAQGSSLTVGLKGLLGTLLGTVTCVLPAVSGQLANILVRTPQQISSGSTVGGGPVSYGGGSTGGSVTSGGSSAGAQIANPCTQPLARAARSARVSARSAQRSTPSRVAPRVVVHSSKAARGVVVACYGTVAIAKASVVRGHAVLRLPRFYPGHYRIAVRYLGRGTFRGSALKVRLTVTG